MKAEFWMTGTFGIYSNGNDDCHTFDTLDDAINYVQRIWVEDAGWSVDIVDMTTGEILVHFEDDEDDYPDYEDDSYLEVGYNPYMGDYDWDC